MKKSRLNEHWNRLTSSSRFDPGNGNIQGQGFDVRRMVLKSGTLTNSLFIESLIEKLSLLLENDPKRQKKIYLTICSKLREMNLIGESYLREELSCLRVFYSQALNEMVRRPHQLQMAPLETSRYAAEFEEISLIAYGGFGQVFKAKNRLDEIDYAIKKIKVRLKDITRLKSTLSEVKTFARLNHPNIVQYKGAWLEMTTVPRRRGQQQPAIDSTDDSNSSSDGSFTGSTDDLVLCPVAKSKEQSLHMESGAILYVCMQLCNETLRQWLDRRNSTDSTIDISLALHMIQQAARGVAYIHSSNVVHHDIKPSNVFITSDLRVQVGDFGLACALGGGECPVAAGHGGTRLYAAPEQSRRQCHLGSDMFSLGLVLIEMLCPFKTDMERASVLGKARERYLPDQLPLQLKELLVSMLARNPSSRPDAVELLDNLHDLRLFYDANESSADEPEAAVEINEDTSSSDQLHNDSVKVAADGSVADFLLDKNIEQRSLQISPSVETTDISGENEIIKQLTANLQRVTSENAETISKLRKTEAEDKKTIERLLRTEASNDDTITQLRKTLEERDKEIQMLRSCLRGVSGSSCAGEYRAHSK